MKRNSTNYHCFFHRSDDDDGASSTSSKADEASPDPDTPDGQWEIEQIVNFVRDDYGLLYHVKWKDWSEDFNTWEPPSSKQEIRNGISNFNYII